MNHLQNHYEHRGKYLVAILNFWLYLASIILALLFVYYCIIDYKNYSQYENSAPAYTVILENTIEFILPAIAYFALAQLLRYFRKRKENKDKSLLK